MRFQIGRTSIVIGKSPYPRPEDVDTLSRLAFAYGVRRDAYEIAAEVRRRLQLPHDRATENGIAQVVFAVISTSFSEPDVVDRLTAGNGLPVTARAHAVSMASFKVQSPEPLVDSVLADFQLALSKQATGDGSI
jgi:hypothetical protein